MNLIQNISIRSAFALKTFALGILLMLSSANFLQACLASSVTVTSIVPSGTDTIVNLQVCIGTGFGGATANTTSFAVIFYNNLNQLPGMTIQSFSPANVTGSFTGCTMPGVDVGPLPSPMPTMATLMYVDPGYYGFAPCNTTPFACINSLAACGPATVQCINISTTVNFLSDNVCVYGLEGGTCDCASMSSPLRLGGPFMAWENLHASLKGENVEISWETLAEKAGGKFHLMRQIGDGEFEEIALIDGLGENPAGNQYRFLDPAKNLYGTVYYKVRFENIDGQYETGPLMAVNLPSKSVFEMLDVYPLPFANQLTCQIFSAEDTDMDWKVVGLYGKTLAAGSASLSIGESKLNLDLALLPRGTYFLQCKTPKGQATKKIQKY